MTPTPLKSSEQLVGEGWFSGELDQQSTALENGYDLSHLSLAPYAWEAEMMAQQLVALRQGVDLVGIDEDIDWAGCAPRRADGRGFEPLGVDSGWGYWSWAREQRKALVGGLDLSGLDPRKWEDAQMKEQRFALEIGHDLSGLDPTLWNWKQMWDLRLMLRRGLDLTGVDIDGWTYADMQKYSASLSTSGEALPIDQDKPTRIGR